MYRNKHNYCVASLFFITKGTMHNVVSASATGIASHSPGTANKWGSTQKAATKNTMPLIVVKMMASPARSMLCK